MDLDVAAELGRPCPLDADVGILWLGQAGFYISGAGLNLLVDPYLSDHLARKYRGREFDHVRMMPAPLSPEQARVVDYVLCTHRHGDHMDPEALPAIMEASARCRLIGPAAERGALCSFVRDPRRVVFVNAGDILLLGTGARVQVLASAHEQLLTNDRGEHHYLGYVLEIAGVRIYHSGDCVLYPGLVNRLREYRIHVALLPINGRDAYRSSRGVPGNFTFDEALEVIAGADIPAMICHHFGMFCFNTVDVPQIRERIRSLGLSERVLIPEVGVAYRFGLAAE